MVLGKTTTIKQYHCYNTNNCTSIYVCNGRNLVKQIANSVCNINQAHNSLNRHPICLKDSDHDYILDEIKCGDITKYERYTSLDNNKELFI